MIIVLSYHKTFKSLVATFITLLTYILIECSIGIEILRLFNVMRYRNYNSIEPITTYLRLHWARKCFSV